MQILSEIVIFVFDLRRSMYLVFFFVTEWVAGNWGSAEPWLGSLCNSSPWATHNALQEAFELSAAAGKPGPAKHACQMNTIYANLKVGLQCYIGFNFVGNMDVMKNEEPWWNSLFVENFHVVSTVILMCCWHDDVSWIFIGVPLVYSYMLGGLYNSHFRLNSAMIPWLRHVCFLVITKSFSQRHL